MLQHEQFKTLSDLAATLTYLKWVVPTVGGLLLASIVPLIKFVFGATGRAERAAKAIIDEEIKKFNKKLDDFNTTLITALADFSAKMKERIDENSKTVRDAQDSIFGEIQATTENLVEKFEELDAKREKNEKDMIWFESDLKHVIEKLQEQIGKCTSQHQWDGKTERRGQGGS